MFYYDKFNSTDDTINDLHAFLKKKRILKSGQIVLNIGSMPIRERENNKYAKGRKN